MKQKVALGLMVSMVLVSVGAFAQEKAIRRLSLADSIELALAQNRQLQTAAHDLDLQKNAYQKTKLQNLLNASIANLKSAELALKQKQDAYKEIMRQLALEDVPDAYYQVLTADRRVHIARASVEESQENLDIVENKHTLGDANDLELLQAEIQLSTAELDLEEAVNGLELARMQFNRTLGLPLEEHLELIDTLVCEDIERTLQDSIATALEYRYEVIQARDALALAELEWKLTQNDYTAELDKEDARHNLAKAKLSLETTEDTIRYEVTQLYLQVQTAEHRTAVAGDQEEEKRISYEIAEEQYKAGLITATDLLEAQINYTQAQRDALDADSAYSLATTRFLNALGTEWQPPAQSESPASGE